MLITIFKSVLLMSVVGAALAVVLLCLKPITRKVFSSKWQYYIWLTVLIVMILPVRFTLPQRTPDIQPIQSAQNVAVDTETAVRENQPSVVTEQLPETRAVPKINLPQNIMWYLSFIWLSGIILILLVKAVKYGLFSRTIHKNSYADNTILSIPKRLRVRRTQMLDAPLIIGLIKPVLYLPDVELTESDINYILMHELTHYKRRDLLYKWFAMLVQCVHWFNPFIYAVSRQIDLECEISCDAVVTSKLTEMEQNNYMSMILDMLISTKTKPRPLTTQMASSKKILKRRFTMIRNKKKTSKFVSVLSAMLAVVMLGTTVFASGVLSDFATDNYTVEITNNGEKVEFTNKPFIENGEVYVPLRETFEKVGVMEHPESKIEWDNGKIDLCIAYYVDDAEVYEAHKSLNNGQGVDSVSFIFNFTIEIGKADITEKNVVLISEGQEVPNKEIMNNAPILKGSNTYIPYSYISRMLDTHQWNKWNIGYAVYDKDGNLIDTSENAISAVSFSADEIAAAKAVVEEYYKAANEKGKRGELKTLTEWHNAPNVILTSDDKNTILTLKDIRYNPNDIGRKEYVEDGRGSVTNTTIDNVIVFRTDYSVSFLNGVNDSAYNEGDYNDWKMILIRDGKDGKWLIDDMGY